MIDIDDGKAVERLRNGDIAGLETLVLRYRVRAMRAAYQVTRDMAGAEDVVSATFLRFFERVDQFDSGQPFWPWFSRMVVNDATSRVRRESKSVSLDSRRPGSDERIGDSMVDESAGPQESAETAEVRGRINTALSQLSEAQRAAIVMKYYMGLRDSEIASELGKSSGTVKRNLHNGRERLRILLNEVRSNSKAVALPLATAAVASVFFGGVLGTMIGSSIGLPNSGGAPAPIEHWRSAAIEEVMDEETARMFEELSPEAQGLSRQIWDRIRATAPEHAYRPVVAHYVGTLHRNKAPANPAT